MLNLFKIEWESCKNKLQEVTMVVIAQGYNLHHIFMAKLKYILLILRVVNFYHECC